MHPDKGSRSIRTDVLTDSEIIDEAYIRLLTSLHREVSRLFVWVSLIVVCARGWEEFNNMLFFKFAQPKSELFL